MLAGSWCLRNVTMQGNILSDPPQTVGAVEAARTEYLGLRRLSQMLRDNCSSPIVTLMYIVQLFIMYVCPYLRLIGLSIEILITANK